MAIYMMCIAILLIGLYAVVAKRNLVKIVIGLIILEYGINLFLILVGYRAGGVAPIVSKGAGAEIYVDPLPQALVVTSIVIGLGVIALTIAICLRLHEKYGTLDSSEMKRLQG